MSIKLENIPMEMLELSVDDMKNVVGGATVKYIVFTDPDIVIGTPPKKKSVLNVASIFSL